MRTYSVEEIRRCFSNSSDFNEIFDAFQSALSQNLKDVEPYRLLFWNHSLSPDEVRLFGEKLAVCSRCSSIYFSFLFVTALYPVIRSLTSPIIPHRNWLLLALLPMLVDVGLEFLNLRDSTFVTRIVTGAIFGGVVPLHVLPAAIEGVQQLFTKHYGSSTI